MNFVLFWDLYSICRRWGNYHQIYILYDYTLTLYHAEQILFVNNIVSYKKLSGFRKAAQAINSIVIIISEWRYN